MEMIRGFLRHIFGRTDKQAGVVSVQIGGLEANVYARRAGLGLPADVERIPLEERNAAGQEMAKANKIPLFEGKVKHGYSRIAAGGTARCPRCYGPTWQYCAHFIYATELGTRVVLAPAGFFCSRCPTAIVDEGMIAATMPTGFEFRGVLGIDIGREKEPAVFETWNGRQAVYFLDPEEHSFSLGIPRPGHGREGPSYSANRKKKQKRQMPRRSRQRSRRR